MKGNYYLNFLNLKEQKLINRMLFKDRLIIYYIIIMAGDQ